MKVDAISYKDLTGTHARIGARSWSESAGIASYLERPAWQQQAACRDKPTEWWFPARGHTTDTTREAKQVCEGCPVREKCLNYAMTVIRRPDGIWGGLTEKQRKTLQASGTRKFRQRLDASHGTKSRFLQGCDCLKCERANARAGHKARIRKKKVA